MPSGRGIFDRDGRKPRTDLGVVGGCAGRHHRRESGQSRTDQGQGDKVVRPVGRSTLSPWPWPVPRLGGLTAEMALGPSLLSS